MKEGLDLNGPFWEFTIAIQNRGNIQRYHGVLNEPFNREQAQHCLREWRKGWAILYLEPTEKGKKLKLE